MLESAHASPHPCVRPRPTPPGSTAGRGRCASSLLLLRSEARGARAPRGRRGNARREPGSGRPRGCQPRSGPVAISRGACGPPESRKQQTLKDRYVSPRPAGLRHGHVGGPARVRDRSRDGPGTAAMARRRPLLERRHPGCVPRVSRGYRRPCLERLPVPAAPTGTTTSRRGLLDGTCWSLATCGVAEAGCGWRRRPGRRRTACGSRATTTAAEQRTLAPRPRRRSP